jgi:hypothetical protein
VAWELRKDFFAVFAARGAALTGLYHAEVLTLTGDSYRARTVNEPPRTDCLEATASYTSTPAIVW